MSKYLMLNDFSSKGVLEAISACEIDLESKVEVIELEKSYTLHYDPDFHCLRVSEIQPDKPLWTDDKKIMELCTLDYFLKNQKPSLAGEIFSGKM